MQPVAYTSAFCDNLIACVDQQFEHRVKMRRTQPRQVVFTQCNPRDDHRITLVVLPRTAALTAPVRGHVCWDIDDLETSGEEASSARPKPRAPSTAIRPAPCWHAQRVSASSSSAFALAVKRAQTCPDPSMAAAT